MLCLPFLQATQISGGLARVAPAVYHSQDVCVKLCATVQQLIMILSVYWCFSFTFPKIFAWCHKSHPSQLQSIPSKVLLLSNQIESTACQLLSPPKCWSSAPASRPSIYHCSCHSLSCQQWQWFSSSSQDTGNSCSSQCEGCQCMAPTFWTKTKCKAGWY